LNLNCSWGVAVAGNGDAPGVAGQRIGSHSFRPLDHNDRLFIRQQVVEVDRVCGARAFVETIEVQVIELHTSGVRIHQRERRTGNVFLSDSQSSADPFHENRFASAERSAEQQDLATFESSSDLVAVVERLLGSRADELTCANESGYGCSPRGSRKQIASLKCSRMSDATIVRMPSLFAAKSPARPPT